MKAIETFYDGYRFRSRLEARWAVFFNALGVDYEYEQEGFELDDKNYYLPDFRVKCWGKRGGIGNEPFDLYIEVKGEMTPNDYSKIKAFCGYEQWEDICCAFCCSDCEKELGNGTCPMGYKECNGQFIFPVLIVGNIPYVKDYDDISDSSVFGCYNQYGYFNYHLIDGDWFGAFPSVSNGKFFLMGDDANYAGGDIERVILAYQKARCARFEHGEKG